MITEQLLACLKAEPTETLTRFFWASAASSHGRAYRRRLTREQILNQDRFSLAMQEAIDAELTRRGE